MSPSPLGARKEGSWYAICSEPSITKTPIGPIQVPVPYQVLISLSQANATASTVHFNGNPAFLLDQSKMQRCMGDEQGTSGGTRSSTTSMEVKPVKGSSSVKMEGKAIVRAGDTCTLNKENCKGKFFASDAPMPSQEAPVPKTVRVHILPRNPVPQAGNRVPLDVIATPAGGTFQWKIKGDARLIDKSGHPCKQGEEVFIEGNPWSEKGPFLEVTVSVSYQSANVTAEAKTTLFVPPASFSAVSQAPTLQSLANLADDEKQWTTGGFRVMGKSSDRLSYARKKKHDITIACFLDGTANSQVSRTNIYLMYDAIRNHEGKWPNDAVLVAGYLSGPGADVADYAGCLLGTGSRNIAERAYQSVVEECRRYLDEEGVLPHIDIYGFSRGSAIANELAWFIYERGIQEGDAPPIVAPRQVPVRFLGLFDTVHSMERPGRDTSRTWHNTTIAPIVQHAAHALAANETRVFFLPSFVERIPRTGKQVEELIFPGVHCDIGGHKDNNHYLMMLSRSWMAEQAMRAGAGYLKQHIISEETKQGILSDPIKRMPGAMGRPYIPDNPLYWEERRREAANKFWGIDKNASSNVMLAAALKITIAATAPIAPLLIPQETNFKNQPAKTHMPRKFPPRIPRLMPEQVEDGRLKKVDSVS